VAQRPRALAEFVAIVDRLLAGYTGDHAGPHYPYQDAATTPGPVQRRVPIIISANGPRALAVAAEHGDGSQERDRDPRTLRRILLAYGAITPWSSGDGFAAMVDRYRAIGFDAIVCYAPEPEEQAVFDKVVGRLDDYR
jgi:hypothetical protein